MISKAMRFIGMLWGATFLRYVVLAYTRHRAARFVIRADGIDHLAALHGQSYILVSNHVRPIDLMLKIYAFKPMGRFIYAIDSFIYQQIIHEQTGHWIRVVAKYGRDTWYASAPMRFLQRHIRQPLSQGQLEAVGYVPVDLKPNASQRDFMKSVDAIIHRGEPLLIFPEGNIFHEFQCDRSLRNGAAHIARKHKIPILPAYITGTHSWRPGQQITVRFGPPICAEGLTKEEIVEEIRASIVCLKDIVQ